MKIGDLVRYKSGKDPRPIAIVIDESPSDSDFHRRIRVMWLGGKKPTASRAFSVNGKRVSTWIHPKKFEVINESR